MMDNIDLSFFMAHPKDCFNKIIINIFNKISILFTYN